MELVLVGEDLVLPEDVSGVDLLLAARRASVLATLIKMINVNGLPEFIHGLTPP